MERRLMKAIIFDLDGTLVDSAPDIHGSTNVLLRSLGHQPLSLETVRGFIGNGVPKLVERVMREVGIAFTPERHQELVATFQTHYTANPVVHTVVYPGVRDVLEVLRTRGYALGVCTNKVHAITLQILAGLRLDSYFDAVVGGDSLPTHKPDPAMLFDCIKQLGADNVFYVGDSEVDAATAVAAQVPFALFTSGYRKTPTRDIAHTTRFSNYADLAGFLSAVGERPVRL